MRWLLLRDLAQAPDDRLNLNGKGEPSLNPLRKQRCDGRNHQCAHNEVRPSLQLPEGNQQAEAGQGSGDPAKQPNRRLGNELDRLSSLPERLHPASDLLSRFGGEVELEVAEVVFVLQPLQRVPNVSECDPVDRLRRSSQCIRWISVWMFARVVH